MSFDRSQIIKVMYSAIEATLASQQTYSAALVADWTDSIVDNLLNYFKQDTEKYKYFVNCSILEARERERVGFHVQCGTIAENSKDSVYEQRWENKAMVCVLVVFRVSY